MHFLRRLFSTSRSHSTSIAQAPIVNIDNGTFYRKFPSPAELDAASNPALFPGLTFSLPAQSTEQEHWAVIGPSNSGKTTLLEILRGQHISIPPTARSFPYLSSQAAHPRHHSPARAIQYVGFNGGKGGAGNPSTRGAYLTARYESRREATDFTVLDYLKGNTDLNPTEEQRVGELDDERLGNVIKDLRLEPFVSMRMGNLSNGQRRRAEIAKALFRNPLVLLLDEPFMGLDPPTIKALDPLLHRLAQTSSPRLILALRPQDPLPGWVNRTIELGPDLHVAWQGLSKPALNAKQRKRARDMRSDPTVHIASQAHSSMRDIWSLACLAPKDNELALPSKGNLSSPRPSRIRPKLSSEGLPILHSDSPIQKGEALVEMHDVCVKYGDKPALGGWKEEVDGKAREGLWWTVRRGERWGLFGPNGSGKTTLLSLICSDHPQSYSLPIRMFGRSRLPQPGQLGMSIFDIQARIGQSSPEIHAFFPRDLTIRRTVESAWADTFLSTPLLTYERDAAVDACLLWFEAELNPSFKASLPPSKKVRGAQEYTMLPASRDTDWADHIRFGDASFSAQRVALFLRAFVKTPDLVVLDEAFSGMDDYVRDKCMLFLTWGEYRYLGGRRLTIEVTSYNYRSQRENMIKGLSDEQALICVSHVKHEVPALVREWIKLPEASSGDAARFGRFKGPLVKQSSAWDEIWRC